MEKVIRLGSDNFHKAMPHLLKWDGGYVDHPSDPGGETNMGISKRAYPNLNIKELTVKDVYGIYYMDYWRRLELDKRDYALAVSMFDAAVNVGVTRVRNWIKEFHGNFTAEQFNDRREQYYNELNEQPRFKVFYKGWMNRLNSLRQFIQE